MPLPVPSYTTADLRHFPRDGQRYELLEGMLLVTPAPGTIHQVVLGRLHHMLSTYLAPVGLAHAVSPGEIEIAPRTLLDPDILVFPSSYPLGTKWTRIGGWWLALEAYGRGSKVYDRDFKRDAYLALGVREVWLVDLREKMVLVSRPGEPKDLLHDRQLIWHPAAMDEPVTLALDVVFAGLP